MEKEVEEKIISLETKLAYMEDFVNQLHAVSEIKACFQS